MDILKFYCVLAIKQLQIITTVHTTLPHLRFEIVYTILGPIIFQCLRGYVFLMVTNH